LECHFEISGTSSIGLRISDDNMRIAELGNAWKHRPESLLENVGFDVLTAKVMKNSSYLLGYNAV
jgi:hypothetical protein